MTLQSTSLYFITSTICGISYIAVPLANASLEHLYAANIALTPSAHALALASQPVWIKECFLKARATLFNPKLNAPSMVIGSFLKTCKRSNHLGVKPDPLIDGSSSGCLDF